MSYRGDTQNWVRSLCKGLESGEKRFDIWVDYDSIIDANTDFRAEMQLGLDRATWVVIVFSPGYFESHWCTYELTTALARQHLSNQRTAWVCIDDYCPDSARNNAVARVHELAKRASVSSADQSFFNDQLKEVLSRRSLSSTVLHATRGDAAENAKEIAGKILEFTR